MRLAAILAFVLGAVSASPIEFDDTNNTSVLQSRATSFWYANMDHTGNYRGYAPDLDPDFAYPVYKTVNSGDGNAIQAAINSGSSGNRHGQWLASQPRVCV